MKHGQGPYRQCVGCRGIFPKEELLRFVRSEKGTAVYDGRQRRPGRGFYLCPQQSCFLRAWKNRKSRAIFQDEAYMKCLLVTVSDTLLESVQSMKGLPVLQDEPCTEKKTPKVSPILRNLRFYERLSSKGRAL